MVPIFITVGVAVALIGGLLGHDAWRRSTRGVARMLRRPTTRRVGAAADIGAAHPQYVELELTVHAQDRERLTAHLAPHHGRYGDVTRELPLLEALATHAFAHVARRVSRELRPGAAPPAALVRALESVLSDAGLKLDAVELTGSTPLPPALAQLRNFWIACADNRLRKPNIPVPAIAVYLDAQRSTPRWWSMGVDRRGKWRGRLTSDAFLDDELRFMRTWRTRGAQDFAPRSFRDMAHDGLRSDE